MAQSPHIETLAIGDELLTGKISDTNSTFVADAVFARGGRLARIHVIADTIPELHALLDDCAQRADAVVCFGGLGPTTDDKTAEGVAKYLGCGLVEHEPSKRRLLEFFAERKRQVLPNVLKQILYPKACTPLPNPKGLAPGFHFCKGKASFFFLPGVPLEMKAMFTESVLPRLGLAADDLKAHAWKCLNIWESELQHQMDPVEAELPPGAWLGYRTRFPENHLTLYYRGEEAGFEKLRARIDTILKPWAYTDTPLELEELVLNGLKRKGWKLALAESCTGGLVSQRLTTVSGASERLWGGYTVYQVAAKDRMLGVKVKSAEEAVSSECSARLAQAALQASGCEVAAAVTGYLEGGTPENPAGTIYLCVAGPSGLVEKRIVLSARERKQTQWGAATYLMHEIYRYVIASEAKQPSQR